MDYQITVPRKWRHRHPAKGAQTLSPGTYSVPEDVPDVLARRAIAEGMATRRDPPAVPAPEADAPAKRRRRAKGPAPQNRMARVPENK